jgi:hypothetical protein
MAKKSSRSRQKDSPSERKLRRLLELQISASFAKIRVEVDREKRDLVSGLFQRCPPPPFALRRAGAAFRSKKK